MPLGPGFYFDPMYFVFIIPAFLLAMYAQYRVKSAYSKWSQVRNGHNISGADVARLLLPRENLNDVKVELVQNQLGDHYDPSSNILRLSPDVAQQPSIASMSVSAHEIGHAAQDRDGYIWLKLRAGIVPLVQIGSMLGYLIFAGGLFLASNSLAWIGVVLVGLGAVFALITLPVELNASNRAMQMLTTNGLISNEEERRGARDMLNAAALTYFAAAAQAISTILYYVFLLLGSSRRQSDDY